MRVHLGDHEWLHIGVQAGVPSVSTKCFGLLRVLAPSQRWFTIEVDVLLAFVAEAAIQDAPGRCSHACTCYISGKHWGHSLQRPSRGRAATCLHEKTRLARGDGSLSLGTYEAHTSCIPPKRSHDGIPPTMTTEGGYGRLHLGARCLSCTRSRASLDHGPQNPQTFLFTVHIGVSRGPLALCPFCL